MQLASGCMWIWFADSIPALVGFLWAFRLPPPPKDQIPFIFLVSRCVYKAALSAWGLITYVCTLRLSHSGALRTQWVIMSRVTKTANYYYYYTYACVTSTMHDWVTLWPMHFADDGGHDVINNLEFPCNLMKTSNFNLKH